MNRSALEEALADATQDLDFLDLGAAEEGRGREKENNTSSTRSSTTSTSSTAGKGPLPLKANGAGVGVAKTGLASSSPLKLASPAAIKAWSKDSLLSPIHSPTDNHHQHPHPHPHDDDDDDDDDDDEDEHLPSTGLASTADSVREFRTGTPIILSGQDQDQDHDPTEVNSPGSNPNEVGKANLKKSNSSQKILSLMNLQDVYLNEFGEKIVNGKVVGNSIGGRTRKRTITPQPQPQESASSLKSQTGNDSSPLNVRAAEDSEGPKSSPPSIHPTNLHGQATSTSTSTWRTSTPPAFFLQSFPDALTPRSISRSNSRPSSPVEGRSNSPLKRPLSVGSRDSDALSNSASQDFQTCDISPSSSRIHGPPSGRKLPSPAPGPGPGPAPLSLGRSQVSAATITSIQSAPLTLHANRRQALRAGVDLPKIPSTSNSTSTSPSSSKKRSPSRRRRKYADEGVTEDPFPLDDDDPIHEDSRSARRLNPKANVVERTTSLFFTPLVQGKQVRKSKFEPDRDEEEEERGRGKGKGKGKGKEEEDDDDDDDDAFTFTFPSKSGQGGSVGGKEISKSEPSSPILGRRIPSSSFQFHRSRQASGMIDPGDQGNNQDQDEDEDGDEDAASIDSLLSLPVSIHTNSSHSPSGFSFGSGSGSRGSDSPCSTRSRELDLELDPSQEGIETDESNRIGMPSTNINGTSVAKRRSYRNQASKSHQKRKIDPDDLFTKHVGIKGWTEVGDRARGFVVFKIIINTKSGNVISILRRFSSFVDLRKALLVQCPESSRNLPPLPRKKLLHKYDAIYLEGRRRGLQKWLQLTMLDPRWGGSRAMRDWVGGKEE